MKIDKTYTELLQEYNLMKQERDLVNEALRKCISDCRVNGFYNPVDAAEFAVRAKARINTLEKVIWDIVNGDIHPHIDSDQDSLVKFLKDKGWRSVHIIEYTVSWEDLRDDN